MASNVVAFRQEQRDIVALAYDELLRFWATLDLTADPVDIVVAMEPFLLDLIDAYGDIGAVAAADFYDDLRDQSPATINYRATVAGATPPGQVSASTRWALAPLFHEAAEGIDLGAQALSRVGKLTDRLVKARGRQTIEENVRLDPAQARYARVPTGPSTCAFCLMVASRGAVYASEQTAGGNYHDHCDCVPTPVWGDIDLARLKRDNDYDPDSLAAKYRDAAGKSNGGVKGSEGILATLRTEQGIK